jgi:2-haloacid dehalogenase
LKKAGLRLAALTNGTPKGARSQLEHAGLTEYFEQIFSVDEVKRFKPAPEPYRMAAQRLAVEPQEVRMVAAWDIAAPMQRASRRLSSVAQERF